MPFTVYKITHCVPPQATKYYVGITQRTLKERLAAHLNESTRKKTRGISEFSLGFAIRSHLQNMSTAVLEDAFVITELASYSSLEEMRHGESHWIATLKTMAPAGYNLMRGGASVGGPANARPCTLSLGGAEHNFISFTAAAKYVALEHLQLTAVQAHRFPSTVRMRIRSGWSLAEAMALEPRIDERSTALSRAARAAGEKVATARSRMHRRTVSADRAATNVSIQPLRDPATDKVLSWNALFTRAGVSPSTGRHRLNQLAHRLPMMTLSEVLTHLATQQDRKKLITIKLPDGAEKRLGMNAWARLQQRAGLGYAAIKSRLRKAGQNADNETLLIAIGVKTAPIVHRVWVEVAPQSRKKHCNNWTIKSATKSRECVNQAAFVNACITAIKRSKIGLEYLGQQPDDEGKVRRSLQARISRETKLGKSPSCIARSFGILEFLLDNP